jgi:D-psicose/D-tagatose/L-ribulose 3-epimerase
MGGIAIHFSVWGGEVFGANFEWVLAEAAEIGYTHMVVPLRYCEGGNIADLRRAMEKSDMRALNTAGMSPDQNIASLDPEIRGRGIEHLKRCVRLARDMGSTQINGVLYGPIEKASRVCAEDERASSAQSLAEVAEFAQTNGVKLAIEVVNRYESNIINTVDQALDFLTIADHPNIALHLDTFHMNIEEANVPRALHKAMPHLAYLELCQNDRGDLMHGKIDFNETLRVADELQYQGLVGVEAFSRSKMAPEHANMLSIWFDRYGKAFELASNAMKVIRSPRQA